MPLAHLSDPQAKEVLAMFRYLDTDGDGLLSPQAARNLCESLGFHLEPPQHPGEPGASSIGHVDLLSWIDTFYGQSLRNPEIQLSQRFALLKSYDPFSGSTRHVSREALEGFLNSEQHKVRPEALDALFQELGDGYVLTREQLQPFIAPAKPGKGGRRAAAQSP